MDTATKKAVNDTVTALKQNYESEFLSDRNKQNYTKALLNGVFEVGYVKGRETSDSKSYDKGFSDGVRAEKEAIRNSR